jgi:hypothetical protein
MYVAIHNRVPNCDQNHLTVTATGSPVTTFVTGLVHN